MARRRFAAPVGCLGQDDERVGHVELVAAGPRHGECARGLRLGLVWPAQRHERLGDLAMAVADQVAAIEGDGEFQGPPGVPERCLEVTGAVEGVPDDADRDDLQIPVVRTPR